MKKSVLNTLLAVALTGAAGSAFAIGGQVQFNGEIVEAACSISGDSTNLTVPLGSIATQDVTGVGTKSVASSFNIVLSNCDTTVAQNASFVFTPTNPLTTGSTGAGRLLGIQGGNNVATGVAIGVRAGDTGNDIAIDGATAYSVVLANGENTLPFQAYYEGIAAAVTPGTANGHMTFVITYS